MLHDHTAQFLVDHGLQTRFVILHNEGLAVDVGAEQLDCSAGLAEMAVAFHLDAVGDRLGELLR